MLLEHRIKQYYMIVCYLYSLNKISFKQNPSSSGFWEKDFDDWCTFLQLHSVNIYTKPFTSQFYKTVLFVACVQTTSKVGNCNCFEIFGSHDFKIAQR